MKLLRKLWAVLLVTLAMNFLALLIAAAMVAQRAQLDAEKVKQVKEVLFPPESVEDSVIDDSATPPEPTPMEQLMVLLDAQSGKPAEDRVVDVSRALDERAVTLDRTRRELEDRGRQIDEAATRLAADRSRLEAEQSAWTSRTAAAEARASDEGFKQALSLLAQLPAKAVKDVFMGMPDAEVVPLVRSMEPRQAAKVLKEFKTPPEMERLREVLDEIRAGEQFRLQATESASIAGE